MIQIRCIIAGFLRRRENEVMLRLKLLFPIKANLDQIILIQIF